jgi:GT2 family glycosyltransferase
VRVVVLDHNGGELTLECLRRLARTEWPPSSFELVLVDNASVDEVASRARQELPALRVIVSDVNRGFAGGCNLALRDLAGVDYVALVNNDVLVDPGWLRPLADALAADERFGAACPKILLSSPMLDVSVRVPHPTQRGRGDHRDLGVRLSGTRVGDKDCSRLARPVRGFWGREHGLASEPEYQWTSGDALLYVPTPEPTRACELRLAADAPTIVELRSGVERVEHTVTTEPAWYAITLTGEPFEVINNVGSVVVDDGYGADRGYLERDDGQYEAPEDVPAWCGAAALLRSAYLRTTGLFDERLFLYYEDLELSLRGRSGGWRYRYVPGSVVRHLHSATSVEGSALAAYYNERNRLLVHLRYAAPSAVGRALVRYVLITASYFRRDVASPLLHGDPPRGETVRRRLRAFAGFLRRAPGMTGWPGQGQSLR